MANTETSRRALVGGGGLAAVALAIPSFAALPSIRIRPIFQASHDAIAAADRHARAFDPVLEAAQERCRAMEAKAPHVGFASGLNVLGDPLRYSTDSSTMVAVCKSVVARGGDKRSPHLADARRLVAASKRREREIARVRQTSGWNAAYEQGSRNNDAIVDAEIAFLSMPVVSLSELALKIDTLDRRECWNDSGLSDWIGTDVRQLANREGRA